MTSCECGGVDKRMDGLDFECFRCGPCDDTVKIATICPNFSLMMLYQDTLRSFHLTFKCLFCFDFCLQSFDYLSQIKLYVDSN